VPHGKVEYGDRPDIVVDGARRIGIEVTNLFIERGELPESEQNQRIIREAVLKKAQQIYLEQGGIFEICFSFNKDKPIRNGNKLIPKIVDNICRVEASGLTGNIPKTLFEDIPELSFIYINSNVYPDPKWRPLQVYDGQIISISRLEEILREKEKKAKKYSKCDTYWLLVVIDFIDSAQDQEIQIEGVYIKSDVYEKIIIYRTVYEHVLELKG
jgi:predicted small secreted protein